MTMNLLALLVAAQVVTTSQGTPPRDTPRPPSQTGTSAIRGRVFAADTGRPLRRANIVITAPELGPDNRQTSTGLDGRFEIKDLPAGRYNVTVRRSGYLPLRYGQRRPLEQGKPLQLLDKQVVENIDFALPRMGLITGRVLDEANEPVAGVQVMAMRSMFFDGRRRLVPVSGGPMPQTDDAGQFRLLGLPPGTYYIRAMLRETWTVTENGVTQMFGYAPTYFPGTTNLGDARRVSVGIGQEAGNIDFSLIPGRAATVAGMAFDATGRPLVGQSVGLTQETRGPEMMMMMSAGNSPVAADGSFTIKNVPPGEYKLMARASGDKGTEVATQPIVVNGVDLDNVSLTTMPGWSLKGRIVTDTGELPTLARDRIRVIARLVNGDLDPRMGGANPDNGRVKDDGTFAYSGAFGPSRLRVTLPDGWVVKAIQHHGIDIADATLDPRTGEELSDVEVVISSKVTTVSGVLSDSKGAPVADGTVIVFATEAEKWSEDSRFVRSARPDQQGQYQIRGLPPGEYFALAMDYVQDGLWNDPEYLESIRRYAQRFTLGESDARTVALKITAVETP
jgi:hypothetical protein